MKDQQHAGTSAKETIRKIREKQNAEKSISVEAVANAEKSPFPSEQNALRQRVSKTSTAVSTQDRKAMMNGIIKRLLLGEISQGHALKLLRIEVLGLKQDAFAKLVGVSRKTLSDVENDKGNYTPDIINKLFRPFGLQVGLVPISKHLLTALLA